MRALILRPEEWTRLPAEAQLPELLPYVEPSNAAVVVVADDSGQIVGCVSVLQVTHLEGLWIKPEKRGNAGIMRALLRLAVELPRVRGEQWVIGHVQAGQMDGFMARLSGRKLSGESYMLPVRE